MARTFTYLEQLERGILTEFRETLWQPFCRSVKRYKLIQPEDKIAVCISGGKDSMLLAKLIQLLHRHTEFPFEAEYLIMDPGYNPENRAKVESNAQLLGIPYTLFESDIFEVTDMQEKNPCFLCARMRRGCLYGKAQSLGCNKIALGHHFDDVIETTLIGMLYGGQLQAMPPKLRAKNFPGMELIRPLYTVREDDICAWRDKNNLEFIQCACRLTEQASREEHISKRQEVKRLIKALHEENPTVEWNIFSSVHNVQLDTMVGWKYKGKEISFLDGYDENKREDEHHGF
ncbi:MAG: tRNA 2-thiocytidine biosynthesis protein TtcA [Clostridia bacterium]|nr:tRNA 2-thiocytidine biosynthesis protein TtcA [Clostridia bacterium]